MKDSFYLESCIIIEESRKRTHIYLSLFWTAREESLSTNMSISGSLKVNNPLEVYSHTIPYALKATGRPIFLLSSLPCQGDAITSNFN